MSIIDLNDYSLETVEEAKPVPADQEYKLRIVSVREDINRNGAPYILPRFEICDHAEAAQFTDYIPLPSSDMPEVDRINSTRRLKRLLLTFGLPLTGRVDLVDELPGQTGWAILGIRDSGDFGLQNTVKRYIQSK